MLFLVIKIIDFCGDLTDISTKAVSLDPTDKMAKTKH